MAGKEARGALRRRCASESPQWRKVMGFEKSHRYGAIPAVAALMSFATAGVIAQDNYPARPVRLIVASSPGGGTDASARIVANKLSEVLGQQVVVDNRPGAATMIGAEVTARAAPDGYTLLLTNSSMTIVPSMRKNPPMEVLRGLAPISLVSTNPQILVGHPSLPAKDTRQLIAFARSRPGQLNYAAGSYGGNVHLCMALFVQMAGVDIVYVPYKSGNAGLVDVLAGQVPLIMASILSALPHTKSGKLRAYGVTTAERSPAVPSVPTIAEGGVAGYDASQWFGMLAPLATPRTIVNKLHGDLLTTLKDPEVQKRFAFDGSRAIWSASPDEFGKFIRSEEAKWAKVIKDAGIKPVN
jgi:tripartite-type tricarboxylate transporter receptor subunit TctC